MLFQLTTGQKGTGSSDTIFRAKYILWPSVRPWYIESGLPAEKAWKERGRVSLNDKVVMILIC